MDDTNTLLQNQRGFSSCFHNANLTRCIFVATSNAKILGLCLAIFLVATRRAKKDLAAFQLKANRNGDNKASIEQVGKYTHYLEQLVIDLLDPCPSIGTVDLMAVFS